MKIVRSRHAFEGLTLEVLGRVRRSGVLYLTLVLPDGTRALVPASFTDLPDAGAAGKDETPIEPSVLASCGQLLDARTIVDALLRRTLPVHGSASLVSRSPERAKAGPEAKESPDAPAHSVRNTTG